MAERPGASAAGTGARLTVAPALVALGSTNPVKRRALERALASLVTGEPPRVVCLEAASGVPDQPWGDAETRRGATNRALGAVRAAGDGAIGIGIEGGVARQDGGLWAFSWVVAVTAAGASSAARSAAFTLPDEVAALVGGGVELGDAMDRLYHVAGSKRDQGAVGLLTGGALDRAGLYTQAVLLALARLQRPAGPPPPR